MLKLLKIKLTGLVNSVKAMAGWKKAMAAVAALIGISYFNEGVGKLTKKIFAPLKAFAKKIIGGAKEEGVKESLNVNNLSVVTAMYQTESEEHSYSVPLWTMYREALIYRLFSLRSTQRNM